MNSKIFVICVRKIGSYVLGGLLFRLAALGEAPSLPRGEDCLRASNLSRIEHNWNTDMTDELTVSGLDGYSLVAPKMQVVVAACVAHARRCSEATAINEKWKEATRDTIKPPLMQISP